MKTLKSILVLALIVMGHFSFAATRTITGTVKDDYGQALPGATIHVKGTTRGVVTDIHGFYSIEVEKTDYYLVFAFVGFLNEEVFIGHKTQIDVRLVPDAMLLQEMVVIGHGKTSTPRRILNHNTGAIQSESRTSAPALHMVQQDFNTESYTHHQETGFRDVLHSHLSTFSIDVDNASYSNMRRFINNGQLPPADAVRIEEMLNYFTYDYPEPTGEHPFSMHAELSQCPWNPKHQLLHVGLKGKSMDKSELPPSNLVFLMDISGSMSSSNRLPLAKTAMSMLLEELRPEDRISIVVYAGRTAVILESTPASEKETILAAINSLQAGGYTAGGQALRLAYQVAENNFIKGGNNRIIMCTDGDFNVGESSNASMERLVEQEREKGVFITVLGFGMGNYKDDRLEIIANKGNGNYAYIDNIQEAQKVLVTEFAGTLFTIAKDVKLQIEFNPSRVKAYRLIGYENRRLNDEDFNNDAKDAGEMGAGHSVTALYEIIPAGSTGDIPGIDPLKYQQNPQPVQPDNKAELLTLKARYKQPDGDVSVMFDKVVQGRVIPLYRTSENFRFAAAVTEFGLLLRDSPFKANASYNNSLKMALEAKGEDEMGYRAEFINLVRTTQNLQGLSQNR